MTEEVRRQFGLELMASHARYQTERDRQYGYYKLTCEREQGTRDRDLARVDPTDRASIALLHDRYDKAVSRADHIYDRYEKRAWKNHLKETEGLRSKYGIPEEVE